MQSEMSCIIDSFSEGSGLYNGKSMVDLGSLVSNELTQDDPVNVSDLHKNFKAIITHFYSEKVYADQLSLYESSKDIYDLMNCTRHALKLPYLSDADRNKIDNLYLDYLQHTYFSNNFIECMDSDKLSAININSEVFLKSNILSKFFANIKNACNVKDTFATVNAALTGITGMHDDTSFYSSLFRHHNNIKQIQGNEKYSYREVWKPYGLFLFVYSAPDNFYLLSNGDRLYSEKLKTGHLYYLNPTISHAAMFSEIKSMASNIQPLVISQIDVWGK